MNADCLYTLSVEDHLQVELHFSEGFDVEQSSDGQCIDALMVTPSLILLRRRPILSHGFVFTLRETPV